MTQTHYHLLESYMLRCMCDSAHDAQHIYRVLNHALQIAETEPETDLDVLIAACLLHDIDRQDQLRDPAVCHAQVGSRKAYEFLQEAGFSKEFCRHVADCIYTHRFRKAEPPKTLEAKILFDADKLDVTGAVGIARSLMYKAEVAEPLYLLRPDGTVDDGSQDTGPSFFREYKFKLEKLYDRFYTPRGAELARQRQQTAVDFYQALYREVSDGYAAGRIALEKLLEE